MPDGVVSMGRAGSYRHVGIEAIVRQAMTMAEDLKQGGVSHPVPAYGEPER